MPLLEVKDFRIEYPSRHGVHAAVKSLVISVLSVEKSLVLLANLAQVNQRLVMQLLIY